MFKNIKNFFNDNPWKEIKTRKIFLFLSVFAILLYIVVSIWCTINGIYIDSTLTENVFDFFKWLVVTGCTITIAKVMKGKTNSDSDEEYINNTDEGEE